MRLNLTVIVGCLTWITVTLPGSYGKFLSFGILIPATKTSDRKIQLAVTESKLPAVYPDIPLQRADIVERPIPNGHKAEMDFHSSFEGLLSTDDEPVKCLDKSVDPSREDIPRKSLYDMQGTWINTIKAIAVCWALLAIVWVAFRMLMYFHSRCERWYYGRRPVSQQGSLFDSQDQQVPCDDYLTHVDNQPPPEYRLFLPPAYDEVINNMEKYKAVESVGRLPTSPYSTVIDMCKSTRHHGTTI